MQDVAEHFQNQTLAGVFPMHRRCVPSEYDSDNAHAAGMRIPLDPP